MASLSQALLNPLRQHDHAGTTDYYTVNMVSNFGSGMGAVVGGGAGGRGGIPGLVYDSGLCGL